MTRDVAAGLAEVTVALARINRDLDRITGNDPAPPDAPRWMAHWDGRGWRVRVWWLGRSDVSWCWTPWGARRWARRTIRAWATAAP